uniref:Thioredoxin domain-containing protein n=1 Tax=Caenorhabditis tropicalis TaxID=1561998 RepID=A0A1I7TPT7_9PELO
MPVVVVNGDSDFDRKFAAANGKAVFVDFTASWCGPCQYIAPVFSDLANQYKGSVFLKVDVDECRGTAASHGVKAMPTFIAFVGGQKKATIQGADESGLRSMVSKYGSTSAAWSGAGQRLSASAASPQSSSTGTSFTQPPRSTGAPRVAGSNPLESFLNIIQSINERGNALAICFFTQPRGAAQNGRGAPGGGAGPSNRPPQAQGQRPFGGSGQRLGGN